MISITSLSGHRFGLSGCGDMCDAVMLDAHIRATSCALTCALASKREELTSFGRFLSPVIEEIFHCLIVSPQVEKQPFVRCQVHGNWKFFWRLGGQVDAQFVPFKLTRVRTDHTSQLCVIGWCTDNHGQSWTFVRPWSHSVKTSEIQCRLKCQTTCPRSSSEQRIPDVDALMSVLGRLCAQWGFARAEELWFVRPKLEIRFLKCFFLTFSLGILYQEILVKK